MMNSKLQLDYEKVTTLFLAYPEGVIDCGVDYSSASTVFNNLIKNLPRKVNLVILVKNAKIRQKIEKIRKRNTIILVNNELSTIWLRDTAGFNMGTYIVKPIFKPKYYRKFYTEANNINQYMKLIHTILGIDMVKVPLIWDGGNLVTNGKIGFITEQLIFDNKKNFSENQIIDIIKTHMGIDPIFIPVLNDDPFAHADGYLSFLNPDTIAISDYPEDWRRKDRKYLQKVKEIVKEYVPNIIEIKEMPTDNPENNFDAKGNYINFLQIGRDIYLPSFGYDEIEKRNRDILNRYGKVRMIDCNSLATFGGLLHCISFTN